MRPPGLEKVGPAEDIPLQTDQAGFPTKLSELRGKVVLSVDE